jgi:hypothetical protein
MKPRHREWMNARLYSVLTQRDVSQESASGQSRPGIKSFACRHLALVKIRTLEISPEESLLALS